MALPRAKLGVSLFRHPCRKPLSPGKGDFTGAAAPRPCRGLRPCDPIFRKHKGLSTVWKAPLMRCLKLYVPVLPDIFFLFLFFQCDNYKCRSHKHGANHHSPLIYCCHAQIACDSADGEHCVYAEKKQAFSQIVPVFMSDIFAYR